MKNISYNKYIKISLYITWILIRWNKIENLEVLMRFKIKKIKIWENLEAK